MKGQLEALQSWQEASFTAAVQQSKTALVFATKAFFDPSMLPALYFPDEHLYAVYSPFFIPVVVPVLGALLVFLKQLKNRGNEEKENKKGSKAEDKEKKQD